MKVVGAVAQVGLSGVGVEESEGDAECVVAERREVVDGGHSVMKREVRGGVGVKVDKVRRAGFGGGHMVGGGIGGGDLDVAEGPRVPSADGRGGM